MVCDSRRHQNPFVCIQDNQESRLLRGMRVRLLLILCPSATFSHAAPTPTGGHLGGSGCRHVGMPPKLPSVHIVDAYPGKTVPRANTRPGSRDLPPVANVRTEPPFPFFHSSERSEDDKRAPQGMYSLAQRVLLPSEGDRTCLPLCTSQVR